jgi:hypothetical protein
MRTNPKAILAAAGIAALLSSPVLAKTRHIHTPAAEEAGAQGSAFARHLYGTPRPANEGGPYTPSIPSPAHGQSRDFQDDERGS